jgi:hypothetical protein
MSAGVVHVADSRLEAEMNCYRCDDKGLETPAVATCHNCGIGLCREHLDEDLLAVRHRGLAPRDCSHELEVFARRSRQVNATRGRVPA